MSNTLIRYHTKTVKYLPMRRSRQIRRRVRQMRRSLSKRTCKRIMRSAYSFLLFKS